ncbi:MAG: hypothetical protein HUJ99_07955 [Bacteroidaceae bacterium]|nr:hypothetical protein [Bacteroidaceae bacterium]
MTEFKHDVAGRGFCCSGCGRQNNKLNTYDWLAGIPEAGQATDLVEVQFKNTRKGYYHNTNNLELKKGDIVAVEGNPGHDIGTVTLTGRLVNLQVKKANIRNDADIKRIYRIAKPVDLEKYEEAKSREQDTMIRSRQIAKDLGLEMKIGDVEYQGDGNKAIFYYIADGRVDFRQLIKDLAAAFHVRIEMKQIGARQEAGRIGGIGPCGREMCCATWMKNFVSVSTEAARFQDVSLNPQKLAGQCAKLKCCINYEVDSYVEASKRLPSREIVLQTQDGDYFFFKSDILSGLVTYSTDKNIAANLVTIPARRAFEVLNMNRAGEKPERLDAEGGATDASRPIDLAEQEDLTRFDKRKGNKKRRDKDRPRNRDNRERQQPGPEAASSKEKEPSVEKPRENREHPDSKPRGNQEHRERRDNRRPKPKQKPRHENKPTENNNAQE